MHITTILITTMTTLSLLAGCGTKQTSVPDLNLAAAILRGAGEEISESQSSTRGQVVTNSVVLIKESRGYRIAEISALGFLCGSLLEFNQRRAILNYAFRAGKERRCKVRASVGVRVDRLIHSGETVLITSARVNGLDASAVGVLGNGARQIRLAKGIAREIARLLRGSQGSLARHEELTLADVATE